jgi:hypothetical protein
MTDFVASPAPSDQGTRVHVHTAGGLHVGSFDLETGVLHIKEVLLATEFAQLAHDCIDRFRSGDAAWHANVRVATP